MCSTFKKIIIFVLQYLLIKGKYSSKTHQDFILNFARVCLFRARLSWLCRTNQLDSLLICRSCAYCSRPLEIWINLHLLVFTWNKL